MKKVRVVKKRSEETKAKISKAMQNYWDNVILVDEEGNPIQRKTKK